jgi:hypothetical protein
MVTKLDLDRPNCVSGPDFYEDAARGEQGQPRGRKQHLHDIMVQVPREVTPFQKEEFDVHEN